MGPWVTPGIKSSPRELQQGMFPNYSPQIPSPQQIIVFERVGETVIKKLYSSMKY